MKFANFKYLIFIFLLSLFVHSTAYTINTYIWDEQRNIISWRAELDVQAATWTWSFDSGTIFSSFNFGTWSSDIWPIVNYTINTTFGSVIVNLVDMVNISNLDHTWSLSTAQVRLESSQTMQDTAPKPASLYTTNAPYRLYRNQYTNWSAPASTTRNAILFEFSWDIWWFGWWFGDIETRTDGLGTAAEYRFVNSSWSYVSWWIIPTSTIDQSLCGDPVNGAYNWCGNRTTRFMWWNWWALDAIKYLLIIIWDDDTNTWENDGNLERLSFIWGTLKQSYYCGDGVISTPNDDDIIEQCDDSNITDGDGCSSTCQIEIPSCEDFNFNFSPTTILLWYGVTWSWDSLSWFDINSVDRWELGVVYTDPDSPIYYIYSSTWVFDITVTISNNLSWSYTTWCNFKVTVTDVPQNAVCWSLDGTWIYDLDNWWDWLSSSSLWLCEIWNISWFVYDTGTHSWSWSCIWLSSGADVFCSASELYCGDNIVNWSEQCDDGNDIDWDSCNNACQLTVPSCTYISVSPTIWSVWLESVLTINVLSWFVYSNLDRWDGSTIVTDPYDDISHIYSATWNFTTSITITNSLSWTINTICNENITITNEPIDAVCGSDHNWSYYTWIILDGYCSVWSISWIIYNLDNITWNCIWYNNWSDTSCSASILYCGDGVINWSEQCDDGNILEWDGCSSICTDESISTWEAPSCTLMISTWSELLNIWFNWSLSSGAYPVSLNLWDWNNISNPLNPYNYTYLTADNYTATLIISDDLSITWSCSASIITDSTWSSCIPSTEICDWLDNDCDGNIDEWLSCSSSSSSSWWEYSGWPEVPEDDPVPPVHTTTDILIWNIFDIEVPTIEEDIEEFVPPTISPKTGADIR